MKTYVISITDNEGLTGDGKFQAKNKTEAMKAARQYIKAWQLNPAKINYCNEEV